MKKVEKVIFLGIILFCLSGCFSKDVLTNDNVYTTIYPIKYITSYLYGNNKTIVSIYPNGADTTTYKLTDKQEDTYSLGALFVYNGLTNEKEIAKRFLSKNKNMLLIDVSYNLKYDKTLEELWLSPNNYLMLAKNIKNNLIEYTTSKVIKEEIESNFKELENNLSYMDAELRDIASDAKKEGMTTIVSSNNKLDFLKKYGFDVINLSDGNINTNLIESNFKNSKFRDIYETAGELKSEFYNKIKNTYNPNIINVNLLYTLTDEEANNNESYMTIMQKFIDSLRNTALG